MNKFTKTLNILTSSLLLSTTLLGYTYAGNYLNSERYSENLNEVSDYTSNVANIKLESLPDVKTTKQGTVTCSTLNVRKGASTKQKVVTKIKKGAKVTVLETTKSGWAKIKTSNNKIGWVSSKYLKITTIKTTTTKKASNSASNTATSKNKNTITISSKPNASTSNTSSKPNSGTSNTTANKDNKIKDSIINEILQVEGKVTSTEKSTLKNNLYQLPTSLLTAVKDSGLKVVLTTKDVKNYYNYSFSGTMTGLFDPMAGKIYISSKVSHIDKSTVHEFGHALDLLTGKTNYSSLSKEWNNIYKAESKTASASYYKSNPQEYFADAFDRYIDNPSNLKAKAPKTYAYIHSAVKNL